MSEALDRRLDRAAKARLAGHLMACAACKLAFRELRQASRLAASAPGFPVSSAFREALASRIAAGEGTPLAGLRSPVPVRERVRFLVLGAAAAALLLVAVDFALPVFRSEEPEAVAGAGEPDAVAGAGEPEVPPAPPAGPGGLRPADPDAMPQGWSQGPRLRPATPADLAVRVAHETGSALADLWQMAEQVEGVPPEHLPKVRDLARRFEDGSEILQRLQERGVGLEGPFMGELRQARPMAVRLREARDRDEVVRHLKVLKGQRLQAGERLHGGQVRVQVRWDTKAGEGEIVHLLGEEEVRRKVVPFLASPAGRMALQAGGRPRGTSGEGGESGDRGEAEDHPLLLLFSGREGLRIFVAEWEGAGGAGGAVRRGAVLRSIETRPSAEEPGARRE